MRVGAAQRGTLERLSRKEACVRSPPGGAALLRPGSVKVEHRRQRAQPAQQQGCERIEGEVRVHDLGVPPGALRCAPEAGQAKRQRQAAVSDDIDLGRRIRGWPDRYPTPLRELFEQGAVVAIEAAQGRRKPAHAEHQHRGSIVGLPDRLSGVPHELACSISVVGLRDCRLGARLPPRSQAREDLRGLAVFATSRRGVNEHAATGAGRMTVIGHLDEGSVEAPAIMGYEEHGGKA